MNILISYCLINEKCRYDGKSSADLTQILPKNITLFPVCPEVSGGLPIPRTPCEINGSKVMDEFGNDKTKEYNKGAQYALKTAKENDCKVAVLKSKSPSCGKDLIYDGTFSKTLAKGNGVTAQLLIKNNIRVFTEKEIDQLMEYIKAAAN